MTVGNAAESPQLSQRLNIFLPYHTFSFLLRVSQQSNRVEGSPSTKPCKSSPLFNSMCEKRILLLELDSQTLNSTTRPTGLCPLYYYIPGCHRRNCFSCFLMPGARHSISPLILPDASHILSSGTSSGRPGGASHEPHYPIQPQTFVLFTTSLSLLQWGPVHHQNVLAILVL